MEKRQRTDRKQKKKIITEAPLIAYNANFLFFLFLVLKQQVRQLTHFNLVLLNSLSVSEEVYKLRFLHLLCKLFTSLCKAFIYALHTLSGLVVALIMMQS